MRYPIPVFLFAFILFTAVLAIKRGKHTAKQEEANESFLERERLANATRKKDISGLSYLTFSTEKLPIASYDDPKLFEYEAILQKLSSKRIINLSKYSNTDLKLMYGPANFNELSEYDDNWNELSATLYHYACRELELGRKEDAVRILEYAVESKLDSSQIYLLLARLYQEQNQPERLQTMKEALSSMDESFRSFVLTKLNASHTDE